MVGGLAAHHIGVTLHSTFPLLPMFIVVRLSGLAKNVPGRNRAGFHFDHLPRVADVTDEQLEIIQNDPYLKICNFPSVAWFEAMGIERTQKNEDKFKDDKGDYVAPKKLISKTYRDAELQDGTSQAFAKEKDGHTPTAQEGVSNGSQQGQPASATPGATDGITAPVPGAQPNKAHELSASSPKEELIAALVRKRKVEGKDFNASASPESLFKLLKSL